MHYAFLEKLDAIIADRLAAPDSSGSYTAELAAAGIKRVAQKVGEEGVELALAAATGEDDNALLGEAADLLYHMSVLLALRNKTLSDACAVLQERHENG